MSAGVQGLKTPDHPEPVDEKPRRLTQGQIIAALLERGGEHSSVKLSRNAKGDTQIEVTVRSGDQGLETIDAAAAKARQLYDELAKLYPMPGADA